MHCTYVPVPPCLPGELVVCAGARAPDGAAAPVALAATTIATTIALVTAALHGH